MTHLVKSLIKSDAALRGIQAARTFAERSAPWKLAPLSGVAVIRDLVQSPFVFAFFFNFFAINRKLANIS
jgi:hypothetical protein